MRSGGDCAGGVEMQVRFLIAAMLCMAAAAAAAEEEAPEAAAKTEASSEQQPGNPCAQRSDVIGVSRIVEIDTANGPMFGDQGKNPIDFLHDGEVVLTFDDGPMRAYTPPILKTLDAHCTSATFFVVGQMVAAAPDLIVETARRGHTIGTHTWSHQNLRSLSAAKATDEIELSVSVASKALGAPVAPFFRFPYLSAPKSLFPHLETRNLSAFFVDVDSKDYRTRNPADVQRAVLSQLKARGKGIVLFHDIQPSTAKALDGLLGELHTRGYKVVHLRSKARAATLAAYDEKAARYLLKKTVAATEQPLATRSLVWPIDGAANTAQDTTTAAVSPRKRTTRRRAPRDNGDEGTQ